MNLTPDIILDRIYLKRSITLWKSLSLILIITILLVYFKPSNNFVSYQNDFIARVKIEDMILQDDKIEATLHNIANNEHVKAVIVHVNSAGGSKVGSDMIYNSIRVIAEKKPVVAVLGTMAASGGYLVALAADWILAYHGTITGSIGVIMQSTDITELAKNIGVNLYSFKSSPLKGSPSQFEVVTDEVKSAVNSVIMDSYNHFVDLVKERRNLPKQTVLQLADGRIYTGNQAKENKLIDAIGGESEAIKWLEQNKNISPNLIIKNFELYETKHKIKKMLSSVEIFGNRIFAYDGVSANGIMAIWNQRAY